MPPLIPTWLVTGPTDVAGQDGDFTESLCANADLFGVPLCVAFRAHRKGLGLSGHEEPLFVLKLDAAHAKVVVGPRSALASTSILLKEVNWLGDHDAPSQAPFEARVKVRSMRPPVAALVTPFTGGAKVELAAPEDAIAPGQACVFYEAAGTRVLGGGWIRAEVA